MRSPFRALANEYARAYRGLPRRAWVLFGVNLVNASGSMVIFFLSLYLTRTLGYSPVRAGGTLGLYGLGSLAGAYLGGWLADRIGSIRVQKLSLASSGALLISLGQVRSGWGIALLIFSLALASGMLYPANATSMSRVCPPELRVKGFTLNRLANNLGATIGPALGGVLALRDYRLLFWADGLTSLAAAAVFSLLWREGRGETAGADRRPEEGATQSGARDLAAAAQSPVRSPWRDIPFLLLVGIYFVWSSVFLQVLTTFPLYMRSSYGLAENRIGQLFAVNTLLIVFLEMSLMERIRRRPAAPLINLSFLFLGAGLALLPFGRGFAFAAFTVVFWTFGEILYMPLITALIAERATDANRGRYMGISSLSFSLAFIVAPSAGLAAYGRYGGEAVWLGCGALCLVLAAAFSALRSRLR